ncbi:MAG: T9SS type A sorting domain-containing protein [Bacteroidales bacterium]|nr:T9SS type A sorting domain-containing protein [Bacteroidales bacterium]
MTLILNKHSSLIVLALTFWLITFNSVISQSYLYFNNRYDINEQGLKDDCYSIIASDDGFVIASSSLVISENIYWWELKLSELDQTGIIQSIKTFGKDSVDYFFTNSGCIINNNEMYYAVAKLRTPSVNGSLDESVIMLLNEELDTIWMRRYGEKSVPYDTSYLFTALQKINQGKIIISGSWKPYGLPTHAYLVETDSSGIMIWQKSYETGFYTEAYSVSQTSDEGFILGCIRYAPGNSYLHDPVIIKTDSLGNEEWIKNLGGDFMDNKAMVCMSKDSMIVIGTNYADSMDSPYVAFSKINIIKIDNDGNIIWNEKYGASRPANYLLNIRILNDNSIIAVGTLRKDNPEPEWVGWILKTDANGDSLWYREYFNLTGQESRNYLYDVIPTSDNGLIACGYVDPYPPDTGSTDTWVIKLDSIGCDSAGCDTTVGIKDDDKTGRLYDVDKSNLDIWPNPASGIVDCRLPIVDLRGDWTLMIYDIFGREVLAPYTPSPAMGEGRGGGWQGWRLDVSALPPGVYFVSVLVDGKRVAGGKFVVSR